LQKLLGHLETCTISHDIIGNQLPFRHDTRTCQRRRKSISFKFSIQMIATATNKSDTAMPQRQQMARQIDRRGEGINFDRDKRIKTASPQYNGQTTRSINHFTYFLIGPQWGNQYNAVAIVKYFIG